MTEIDRLGIRRLFKLLLELPEAERASALTRACEDDPELRRELEALLRAHEDGGASPASLTANGSVSSLVGLHRMCKARDTADGGTARCPRAPRSFPNPPSCRWKS